MHNEVEAKGSSTYFWDHGKEINHNQYKVAS